ncbi:hypothetical protein ACKU3N_004525 [Pseudomonas putida]
MSSEAGNLLLAADHLLKAIDPPSQQSVSIATFFRPGRPIAIRVTVLPEFSYLISRVPESIDGFDVLREVAQRPVANYHAS